MIRNKMWKISITLILIVAIATIVIKTQRKPPKETLKEISPVVGNIQSVINSTAIIQPDNRLEIKPPINGRIDEILAREGDVVKEGQIVAWMSSTERAALLDAARAQGADAMKYWEEVYKPTPLISPISGEVIVSTNEPGQTVTSTDIVIVLSDHLVAQAQVDETDIGKVKAGQEAIVTLDAYPEIKIKGKVDHIFYESKLVNNVNIYQVDIILDTVPTVFRSGMTSTVNIIESSKDNVLLIPLEAVKRGKKGTYVLMSQGQEGQFVERNIETGISDEKNTEVLSGLSQEDKILISNTKYVPVQAPEQGNNPFMPSHKKSGK